MGAKGFGLNFKDVPRDSAFSPGWTLWNRRVFENHYGAESGPTVGVDTQGPLGNASTHRARFVGSEGASAAAAVADCVEDAVGVYVGLSQRQAVLHKQLCRYVFHHELSCLHTI